MGSLELLGCPLTLSGWHVPGPDGECRCGWLVPEDTLTRLHAEQLRAAAAELRARYALGLAS